MAVTLRTASTRQHEVLIAMARTHGLARGVEVGVLKGKTLRYLLGAIPILHMTAVDRWQYLPDADVEGHETYAQFNFADAEQRVRAVAAEFPGRCVILKGASVAMAERIADASLDFVFLDALHTMASTLADIRAWSPKVRIGGYVTGHDWWWPSVAAALEQAAPGRWLQHDESVWSIRKAPEWVL